MIGLSTLPVGGAQHDMRIFRESNVNNLFREAQLGNTLQGIMLIVLRGLMQEGCSRGRIWSRGN